MNLNTAIYDRLRLAALLVLFVTLPMQWGRLGFPGVSLNIREFGAILFVLLAGICVFGADRKPVSPAKRHILISFSVLLAVTIVAFLVHGTLEGFDLVKECVLYIIVMFLLFGLSVRPSEFAMLGRISAISILVFFVLSGANMGMNFIFEYIARLVHYDYRSMLMHFYRPLFNAFSGQSGLDITGSRRNAVSMSLLVVFMLMLVPMVERKSKSYLNWLDFLLILFVLTLLISMFARSSLLVLSVASLVILFSKSSLRAAVVFRWFLALCFVAMSLLMLLSFTDIADSVYDRIFHDTFSYEFRLGQVEEFFSAIDGQFLTGVGFYITYSGYTLHNLFLGNWAHAGLIGLLCSITFYFLVGTHFFRMLFSRKVAIGSILCLPFLVKTMVGGNAGFPELSVLIGVVLSFSILDANRRRRRQKNNFA